MSELDTSRPTAIYTPTNPRPQTLSIALPTSLLSNSKKRLDLRTSLVGSISRALAIFAVDEIVLFDDGDASPSEKRERARPPAADELTAFSHPGHFMQHILEFQETPPFLRSKLFPHHVNLGMAGVLPSLDIPSHLRQDEWCEYREGVVVRNAKEGSYVDCGLERQRLIRAVEVPVKTRVTLRLLDQDADEVEAVAPDVPRTEGGWYWGYQVRQAESLSAVFTECGWDGGYDLSIGTSERGQTMAEMRRGISQDWTWQHLVIVIGGVSGLEAAADHDPDLRRTGIGKANVNELFDYWVDLCPGQGSRTIRTEEAVWMSLMATREMVVARQNLQD